MAKLADVLDSPEIRRRTQRVLELKDKARQAQAGLAFILADLGAELIAAKAALDRTSDKTAWLRWLSGHVKFSIPSAENYMRLARLRKKFVTGYEFFARLPLAALYLIAALPDALVKRLEADPRLPSPKTGALKPIEDMDERELKAALARFKGRRPTKPGRKRAPAGTRQELARAAIKSLRDAMQDMQVVNDGSGKLDSDSKRAMLDELDDARAIVLHWKAWVTPEKRRS